MKTLSAILICAVLSCLSACSTVTTQVNYSGQLPVAAADKTYVFEQAPTPNADYANYQNLVRAGLQAKGYTEAVNQAVPHVKVEFNYSTTPKDTLYAVAPYPYSDPYWHFHRGYYYPGFYYPYPGMWGPYGYGFGYPFAYPVELEGRRYFEHRLDLVINSASDGKKLLDISATNDSMDDKIADDMPKLVDSVFKKFPDTAGSK